MTEKSASTSSKIMEGGFYVGPSIKNRTQTQYCHANSKGVWYARMEDSEKMKEYHTHNFLFKENEVMNSTETWREAEVKILGAVPKHDQLITAMISKNGLETFFVYHNGICTSIFHLTDKEIELVASKKEVVLRVLTRRKRYEKCGCILSVFSAELCLSSTMKLGIETKKLKVCAN